MHKLRAVSRSGVPIRIVKMDLVSSFVQTQGKWIITDRGEPVIGRIPNSLVETQRHCRILRRSLDPTHRPGLVIFV